MKIFSRFAVPLALATFTVAGAASAVVVPGVYDTGVGNGVALAAGNGQVDPHYVVVSTDETGVAVGSHALTYYNPAYLMDGPMSRIVNATGDGSGTAGTTTTFETTFSLAHFDPMNATLSGQSLFDNSGEVLLNGHQIGSTITGFGTLTPFGTSASFFVAGTNKLDFVLHNQGGPEAFQVAGLTVTAASTGAVPEPTSWALMLGGFGMVGFAARRRKSNVVAA